MTYNSFIKDTPLLFGTFYEAYRSCVLSSKQSCSLIAIVGSFLAIDLTG